ncbi:MAG: ribose 5-phosphate isomerase B [Bacteroidales bacterium]|nr:ribose 5-phosphate isomerase B [Bacteroidales bacterium]
MKTIGIAADHAGFGYKEEIAKRLVDQGYSIVDFGTYSSESMDYPDVAHPLAYGVEQGDVAMGIALCGSGNGINMTLNKHQGVRSALCWTPEIAALARQHNDANICAIPARFLPLETVFAIIDAFLHASFEGGRHQTRVEKIPC